MIIDSRISTNSSPTNKFNDNNVQKFLIKTQKKRGRPRKTRKHAVTRVKQKPKTMDDLSIALRMECLRLAEFIKQGTYRKASVL